MRTSSSFDHCIYLVTHKGLNVLTATNGSTQIGPASRGDLNSSPLKSSLSTIEVLVFGDQPSFCSIWEVALAIARTEFQELTPPLSYLINISHGCSIVCIPYLGHFLRESLDQWDCCYCIDSHCKGISLSGAFF